MRVWDNGTMAEDRGERIGINVFGRVEVVEAMEMMARCGFGAVDVSAAAGRLASDAQELERVKAGAVRLGLAVAGTHFRSFGFGFLATVERRAAFRREAVEDVRAAAFLGAPAVAFHLANEGVPEEELAAANAEALATAVRVAEEEGVIVALENHCHGWGDRWGHLSAVADLLGSRAVGFTLDSGHAVVAGEDPAEMARRMGRRLALTHLHDNDGSGDLHRPAGRSGVNGAMEGGGRVDWPALIGALRAAGYPKRNAWVLEGGTQVAGDDVEGLLAAHIAAFRQYRDGATG